MTGRGGTLSRRYGLQWILPVSLCFLSGLAVHCLVWPAAYWAKLTSLLALCGLELGTTCLPQGDAIRDNDRLHRKYCRPTCGTVGNVTFIQILHARKKNILTCRFLTVFGHIITQTIEGGTSMLLEEVVGWSVTTVGMVLSISIFSMLPAA